LNNYKNLSGNEFYFDETNPSDNFSNLGNIPKLSGKKINVTSILSILTNTYTLDTQTTVEDISCQPWMSSPKVNTYKKSKFELPRHYKNQFSFDKISSELKKKLLQEALNFLLGKNSVGILLTGGMDSRVVAGIIKELQIQKKYGGKVVALTWGLNESRDVIYSKKIANRFGWKHRHFKISPELLKENIFIAAERGALYSPIHLHAMKDVSKTVGLDGIFSASYGDSVGRAEFSGVRVENLPDILKKDLNSFSFILQDAKKYAMKNVKDILKKARDRFPGRNEQEYREIEKQMHYMRRSLHSSTQVINEKIPLYQMFTDQNVFAYMWSLNYNCRTNDVYAYLLKKLPGNLIEIPWARTGKKYNQAKAKVKDDFLSINHHYGIWLRNDLRNFVIEKILNGNLQKIGIFNTISLKIFCKIWKRDKTLSNSDRLDEQMAWLASLSIFIEKYNIKPDKKFKYNIKDTFGILKSIIYYQAYFIARKIYKTLKR
jgi:hypothetical protein